MKMNNKIKEIIKANMKNCLYYGYGLSYVNTCGINKDSKEIQTLWIQCIEEMGEDF